MAIFAINSARELGIVFAIMCGVYVFFLLLGVGISSLISFSECGKTDTASHFRLASMWALGPSVAYLLIRSIHWFLLKFEVFFAYFFTPERSGWISMGYAMMLACLAGIFWLIDYSIEEVCIPTVDEATAFRNNMLAKQAEKAATQEMTPAVQ